MGESLYKTLTLSASLDRILFSTYKEERWGEKKPYHFHIPLGLHLAGIPLNAAFPKVFPLSTEFWLYILPFEHVLAH